MDQVCTCSIGGSGPYGHSVGNVVMPSKSSEAAETAPGNNEETGEGEAPATLSNRVASGVSRLQSFLLERIDPVLFHSRT